MDDAALEREQARVERLHATWAQTMGVSHVWTVHITYYRAPLDARPHADRKRPPECEHLKYGRAMQITAQWEYQTADLEINCLLTERLTDGELTEYFLHELGHLYLSGLATVHGGRQERVDHAWYLLEEHTATSLAFAWKWLAEGVWKDGLDGVYRHAEYPPSPETGQAERPEDEEAGPRDLRQRPRQPEGHGPGQEPDERGEGQESALTTRYTLTNPPP